MEDYTGRICPICNDTITERDAVITCPECGIPHHVTCWKNNDGCFTEGCSKQGITAQGRTRDNKSEKGQLHTCSKCGSTLENGYDFCPKCGTPKNGVEKRYCSKCNTELEEGQAFCSNCGTMVGSPKKKKKAPIIISIIAVLVIGVSIWLFCFDGWNMITKKKPKETSSSSDYVDYVPPAWVYCKVRNVKVTHEKNSNYTYIRGSVENTSDRYSYRYIRVQAKGKDRSGKVIQSDDTYAVGSVWLEPGESNDFKMMIEDPDGKIKTADVSIMIN